jgi:hypothetical protein
MPSIDKDFYLDVIFPVDYIFIPGWGCPDDSMTVTFSWKQNSQKFLPGSCIPG